MSITITINGGEISTTTISPQSTTATSPQTSIIGAINAGAAPTKIGGLASQNTSSADAGAIAAGSAPSEIELSGMINLPNSSINQNISTMGVGGISVGAAPSSPSTDR